MRSMVRRSLVLSPLWPCCSGCRRRGHRPGGQTADTRVAGIDVDATTIPQLEKLMNAHRLTSVQLVQFYLHRISKLNPKLHAVITVSPTALADARAADRARRRGDRPAAARHPDHRQGQHRHDRHADHCRLLGAGGQHARRRVHRPAAPGRRRAGHRQGQPVRVGQLPLRPVVERLERDRRPDEHALRARPQPLRLELRLRRRRRRRPRGRGVGTETDGSVVCPSGANGVAGIKPTLGLLSRAGIVPISADQDTAGPMARNVTDAAVLLGAMTGVDPDDPATAAQAGHAFTDYTQFLDAHALEGARIGVWREAPTTRRRGRPGRRRDHGRRRSRRSEAQGATIVDPADIDRSATGPTPSSRRCCASSRPTSRRTSRPTRRPATRRRSRT